MANGTSHGVLLTIPDAGGGMPVPECIVRERRVSGHYQHRFPRPGAVAVVQVTLAGCGRLRSAHGVQRVPVGCCQVFTYSQNLEYAVDPSGSGAWEFIYVNLTGQAALAMAGDLTDRHGHVLRVDLESPAVRRLTGLAGAQGLRACGIDLATAVQSMCDLFAHLIAINAETTDDDARLISSAIQRLTADLAAPPAVAAVAAACGVSREHLILIHFQSHNNYPIEPAEGACDWRVIS